MIETFKRHLSNDIKLARSAWDTMDTISHVLVIMGMSLLVMCTDMLCDRIHL